jgi:hypothetical protein
MLARARLCRIQRDRMRCVVDVRAPAIAANNVNTHVQRDVRASACVLLLPHAVRAGHASHAGQRCGSVVRAVRVCRSCKQSRQKFQVGTSTRCLSGVTLR